MQLEDTECITSPNSFQVFRSWDEHPVSIDDIEDKIAIAYGVPHHFEELGIAILSFLKSEVVIHRLQMVGHQLVWHVVTWLRGHPPEKAFQPTTNHASVMPFSS